MSTAKKHAIGMKHDAGKPDWSLLPWGALREVVKVLDFGAQTYARDNWRLVENADARYSAALMRHITDWAVDGEWLDPESGLPHLAHVVCNGLFLLAIGMDRR